MFNGINIWFENNELITLAYFFHLDGNICAFDEFEFKNPTGIEADAQCSRRILPLVKDEIKRMIMKPTFLKGRPEGKHEIIVNGELEYTDDLLFIEFNALNDIDEKSMASCACDIFMMRISEFLEKEKGMPIEISLTSNTLHVSPSDFAVNGDEDHPRYVNWLLNKRMADEFFQIYKENGYYPQIPFDKSIKITSNFSGKIYSEAALDLYRQSVTDFENLSESDWKDDLYYDAEDEGCNLL